MSRQGLRIGSFTLEERIGRGGMGEVWRACDEGSGLRVACKVLVDHSFDEEGFGATFEREVSAMAKLRHPNIAMIYDTGVVEDEGDAYAKGTPYFVMEFVEGVNLKEYEERLDWEQLKRIALELLSALGHSHGLDLIHRDLKPHNIMLTASRVPKLIDFGIVQQFTDLSALEAQLAREEGQEVAYMTGTPKYMSPEQITGHWRTHGPWTDLYALGCVLWEMVCGVAPFSGTGVLQTLRAHVEAPLPVFSPRMNVPVTLEGWLRRLLAKEIPNRIQFACEAAWELEQLDESTRFTSGGKLPRAREGWLEAEEVTLHVEAGITSQTMPLNVWGEDVSTGSFGQVKEHSLGGEISEGREVALSMPMPESWRTASFGMPYHVPESFNLWRHKHVEFIGRHEERDLLWRALGQVHQTKSMRVVSLEGSAGCGKSKLAQWLCELAHEVAATWTMSAHHVPYPSGAHGLGSMLVQFFRTFGLERQEIVAHLLSQFGAQVTQVDLSAIVELLAPSQDQEDPEALEHRHFFSSQRERHQTLLSLVELLASKRPLVLWVDDAQWGIETLQFLQMLTKQEGLPVLVVLTMRSDLLSDWPAVESLYQEVVGAPYAKRVTLEPLSEAEQVELVGQLIELEPGVRGQLVSRTQGNPLFTIQLLDDWITRGVLLESESGYVVDEEVLHQVPDSLHQVWLSRMDAFVAKFPASGTQVDVRRAVNLAALLGQHIDQEEWRTLLGLANLTMPQRFMEQLVQMRLVTMTQQGWSFSHGMFCESLQRLMKGQRDWEESNALVAMMIQHVQRPKRMGDGQVQRRHAWHLIQARRWEEALEALDQGIYRSLIFGQQDQALAMMQMSREAIEASEQYGDSPAGLQVDLHQAYYYRLMGKTEDASMLVEDVLHTARSNGWNLVRSKALIIRAHIHSDAGRFDLAIERLDEALGLMLGLEPLPEGEIANVHMALNAYCGATKQVERAKKEVALAREYYARENDFARLADCAYYMGSLELSLNDIPRARVHLEEAQELASRIGYKKIEAACLNTFGHVYRELGDFAQARQMLMRACKYHLLGGYEIFYAVTMLNVAYLDVIEHQAEGAKTHAMYVRDKVMELGYKRYVPGALCVLVYGFSACGDLKRAKETLHQLLGLYQEDSAFDALLNEVLGIALEEALGRGLSAEVKLLLGVVLPKLVKHGEPETVAHMKMLQGL